MDIIFYNGRIQPLDRSESQPTAVGVTGGLISAVGSDTELRRDLSPRTEAVDLKGAVLFPGFMEAHNHLPIHGYLLDGLDLSPSRVRRMDDLVRLIGAETEKRPPGAWIKGSRHAEYFLAENRHPTRWDLDPVSPDHPVVLFHTSMHACVLNSRGLAEFGLTGDVPSPKGGLIEKDRTLGQPNGVLHDQAMMDIFNKLFFNDLAAMSPRDRIVLCQRTTEKFASLGLTLAADALTVPQTLAMYQEALAAGGLKIRIYTMNYEALAEPLTGSSIRTGFGNEMLRIGPIKLFADGGMSNRTAAVSRPYLTPPHERGLKLFEPRELIEKVKKYHSLGYQIAVHAQGDEGIKDTLDAFEAVLGAQSDNPLRHRIEHGGCMFPDLLKRAAAMNIPVAVQPVFFSELGDGFLEAFGPETAHQLYPFKSMLQAGLKLGGSSDSPVSNLDPRLGLAGAVLRRTPSGVTLGPQEALSVSQAIQLYTQGSAWLSFDENRNGTIEPGRRADFTVMAENPVQVGVEEIPDIPFTMTVVGGEVVWSA